MQLDTYEDKVMYACVIQFQLSQYIERPHILKYYRSISFKLADTISISDTDYCNQEISNWLELILLKYSRLVNLNLGKKRRCEVYTRIKLIVSRNIATELQPVGDRKKPMGLMFQYILCQVFYSVHRTWKERKAKQGSGYLPSNWVPKLDSQIFRKLNYWI